MTEPELRDKEHLILQQIQSGNNDVQKITSQTTLENHHVTYAFQKLEELQLIEVSKPDGRVERIIDGQKRVFQHPKQAELTQKGEQYLEHSDQEDIDQYENLSHRELVDKIHQLEDRTKELENRLELFQQQVKREF
jgi:predicted transcriptional regulator